jgi:hypothetical protein
MNPMKSVSPRAVLSEIAAAVPQECRKNIIIIGSLAVGYHFFAENESIAVRTKDADCLLSPRLEAVSAGECITEQLIDSGWKFSVAGGWGRPGDKDTPLNELSAVRLHPPGNKEWFIELLTVPETPAQRGKRWQRLHTAHGDFGLPSFGFLSLTNYRAIQQKELGVAIARPELMALANMLEHPQIKPELMSGLIQGRAVKRSNKDLGRVLAIAFLSTANDPDSLEDWPKIWEQALKKRFPDEWRGLAANCGSGIRKLLGSDPDFNEAWHTCRYGLLASLHVGAEQLRIAGQRLLQDAVEPLELI